LTEISEMAPKRIGIVDVGVGNLRSVSRVFQRLGHLPQLVEQPSALEDVDLWVVPGQAEFGVFMARLTERGFVPLLRDVFSAQRPYLGLCMGMQILFDGSEEAPGTPGLGVLPGQVRKFRPQSAQLKVPHMGWNEVQPKAAMNDPKGWFYFVHSFYCEPRDAWQVTSTADYGDTFCASVRQDNIVGFQFHPEKSQRAGEHLLQTTLARFFT